MAKKVIESDQPKYSKENGCPKCGGSFSDFKRMAPNLKEESKLVCENCGAIFHNLNINDKSLAGTWTGYFSEIGKRKRIEHSFTKDKNNDKNNDE